VAKIEAKKPNIVTKHILKPSVSTMVENHFELYTIAIKVGNQMAVIQVQVGKIIIEDILIDGRTSVNIITENLGTKLNLPKPIPAPY
jgi:hypothetical protein